MNFEGIIIGIVTFVIIGIFHPLVVKSEYYLGRASIWVFLISGVVCVALSLISANFTISALLGVLGFTCLWSIKEVIDQEKRVKEGRYPKNPRRKY
ncbi:MAG: DUF4491 family protein [Bacteroidales bacterium]|jgi:branched-subunit amino acid transport protein|nr:DUF4491 family protein [Bacteroidales bacterium]MDD3273982.1 DUF4491 family protein [Bacteroidales bacterium]MDD4058597.1 DUF4491 family protein [Bacteroidales bacterium]